MNSAGPQAGLVAALLVAVCVLLSWVLTARVRSYALRRSLLDVPNDRSSHTVPTPRGGGLAIGVVVLTTTALGVLLGLLPAVTGIALLGGGALVAAGGWIDDRRSLTARIRLTIHVSAALWALFWLGGMPEIRTGVGVLQLGWLGNVLATLGIIWLINLYNFMDGTDGIAASESLCVAGIGFVLLLASGDLAHAALMPIVFGASAGFLLWNWPPARIFMGDVGSGLLGFVFAVTALATERTGSVPLLAWVLLLGVFGYDATITLIRRALHRERVYEAHRSHAYQRLVRAGWTHAGVARAVVAVNVLLGSVAYLAVRRPALLTPALLTGIGGLTLLYYFVERLYPMYPGSRPARRTQRVTGALPRTER